MTVTGRVTRVHNFTITTSTPTLARKISRKSQLHSETPLIAGAVPRTAACKNSRSTWAPRAMSSPARAPLASWRPPVVGAAHIELDLGDSQSNGYWEAWQTRYDRLSSPADERKAAARLAEARHAAQTEALARQAVQAAKKTERNARFAKGFDALHQLELTARTLDAISNSVAELADTFNEPGDEARASYSPEQLAEIIEQLRDPVASMDLFAHLADERKTQEAAALHRMGLASAVVRSGEGAARQHDAIAELQTWLADVARDAASDVHSVADGYKPPSVDEVLADVEQYYRTRGLGNYGSMQEQCARLIARVRSIRAEQETSADPQRHAALIGELMTLVELAAKYVFVAIARWRARSCRVSS